MIHFTKMQGLGNDYVYVNCFDQDLTGIELPALARAMSERHRGIGADGLILMRPPSEGCAAEVRMEMYNADGSRGAMCGNGIRCVAKYAIEHGLIAGGGGDGRELAIETDGGVRSARVGVCGGCVCSVRVDMGTPKLRPEDIPVLSDGEMVVRMPIEVAGRRLLLTCVSMGNPHAVVFDDRLGWSEFARLGQIVEHLPIFPNRANVHLATCCSRGEVAMRSWERGSGLTQACGTGACAVLVAGVLEGRLDRSARILLPGGELEVEWPEQADGAPGSVFMTGPAVEVFTGEWPT
jgi:diaminopimelate epimerase